MRQSARVVLSLLALTMSTFAQSDRGTITGTVSDPAEAVVPNAPVVAKNSETGAQYQTVTTATGNFTLPSLPAGVYDLSVSAAGFLGFVQQGIRVQVAQTARIDVVLKVGSTKETVTVTADAPLLRTESVDESSNITRDGVDSLPLSQVSSNVRSPMAFTSLTPSATDLGSGAMRVNGQPNSTYKFLLDGQDITSSTNGSGTQSQAPSVEAMQEFVLQTSNFSAEFGQVTGGLYNVTSRSGTNQFHGSAYEYLVNEDLNAGQPFTNSGHGHLVRPRSRKNNFGFTVGGPITIPKLYHGRDKTFFFANFEQFRQNTLTAGTYATVPTAAMRNGDFSAALTGRTLGTDPLGRSILENVIYDPLTSRTASGVTVRDPFPNNTIPVARFDPVAVKIQALIPQPSNSALVNNWQQIYENPFVRTIPSVKIDHYFGGTVKMSAYYAAYLDDSVTSPEGLPSPLTAVRVPHQRSDTARLTLDDTITPTLLVHFGVGYIYHHNPDIAMQSVLDYDAVAGIGLVGGSKSGFPRITGLSSSQGGMSLGMGPTNANDYYNDKPTAVLSATLVRGNHTYKAGGEFRIDTRSDKSSNGTSGNYAFSAVETGLPSTQGQSLSGGSVGFPYASFLLGAVDSASVSNYRDPQMRKNAWGFFVQDTWKVTHKLTLDYGLRWDYQTAPRELWNRISMFAPTIPNPSAGGRPGALIYAGSGPGRCNCPFTHTYPYAFGPRLGAAWQILPKTVLRAGWGITYGTTSDFAYIYDADMPGLGWNTLNFTTTSYGDPAILLHNGLQYNRADLFAATYDPGLRPSPGQINSPGVFIDPGGGRPPRVNQWSIGLQREITKDLVVEASYVGNRGAWLQANSLENLNAITPQRLQAFGLDINNAADRTLLTSKVNSALAQSRGFGNPPYASWPTSLTVAQMLRPYPQFGNLTVYWAPLGDNWYDSLQMKVTKRYSHGLTATAAFSWQKELTLGAEDQTGNDSQLNNVFNRQLDKTLSSNSRPLVFVTGYNYRLPKLGQNRWIGMLLRDWTISGVLRYQSGTPIPVPGSQNALSSLLFQTTFANRVPGQPLFLKDPNCRCIDPNKDFVLNPKAWSDPAAGQWGTAAPYYNDYRYQRKPIEQMSLGRVFRLREGMTFEFRGEFFNVFNRTSLNNPTASNALATQVVSSSGVATSGFGYSNPSGASTPRSGQLLARFQF